MEFHSIKEIENAKNVWWDYFINTKKYWFYKCTKRRLEKIKKYVFESSECDYFWEDILLRHNVVKKTPEEVKEDNFENFGHCIVNMTGMLCEIMMRKKIIKFN